MYICMQTLNTWRLGWIGSVGYIEFRIGMNSVFFLSSNQMSTVMTIRLLTIFFCLLTNPLRFSTCQLSKS